MCSALFVDAPLIGTGIGIYTLYGGVFSISQEIPLPDLARVYFDVIGFVLIPSSTWALNIGYTARQWKYAI